MKLSSVEGKLLTLFCNMYTSISDKIQKEISSDGLRIMGQSGASLNKLYQIGIHEKARASSLFDLFVIYLKFQGHHCLLQVA
jgi:hypothetical protein